MDSKPMTDKIAELDEKIAQIKAQKKALLNREKAEERKKRDHRLIVIGATVEKYCGVIEDMDAFEKYISKYGTAIKSKKE